MVDPRASLFWQATEQNGLITAAGLRACWAAIPEEKRVAEAIDRRLAREAVAAGYLTLWQAQQVLAGRAAALRIDRYLVLDLIGQGGMGRVYLARDTRLGRKVAMKVISRDRLNNPRALARFRREVQVGAQLQHENLVRVYDEGEARGGIPYLVMEYIEGRTVGQILAEDGPIPPATAARIARQVALGLQHAHEKGVIHRDVNPQNILMTRDGTAKLTDLGLALDLADLEQAVTREGSTVGTFDYLAPEQARHSRSVDGRSDIYSLGCTFYHMIAGEVPFPGPSLPEKLYAHQLTEPEPLAARVPGLPAGLDDVVRRMMKKAAEERYQTPLEVAQVLEPYAADAAPPTHLVPSPAPPERPASGTLIPVPQPASTATGEPSSTDEATSGSPAASDLDAAWAWLAAATDPNSPATARAPTAAETEAQGLSWLPSDPQAKPTDATAGTEWTGRDDPRPRGPGLKGLLTASRGRRRLALLLALAAALTPAAVWKARVPRGDRPQVLGVPKLTKPRPAPIRAPILIRLWNDDTLIEEPDFQEAMNRAFDRGTILLSGPETIPLPSKTLVVPRGSVVIRAAPGQRPTLEAKMPEQGSLWMSGSGSSLTLSGLQIVVTYPASSGAQPDPVIDAGGDLTLENCIIWCNRPARGSRAVLAQGGTTNVTGCLIQDFDQAVALSLFRGARVQLRQSMLVYTKAEDDAPRSAVGVRYQPSQGTATASLILDHCTVALGEGSLVDVAGLQAEEPLALRLSSNVVRAGALLLWRDPVAQFPGPLGWSGKGNRYDVRKPYWVVLPPKGLDGLPDGPTDLDSWNRALGDQELDPRAITVRWADPDVAPAAPPDPAHFTLASPREDRVGADPKQVGPQAMPAVEKAPPAR